ncbi:hypothetical protein [Aquabacterium sp.]|uniref:hypothetical protein n=1 Tax=Aquabacterium sp. TaxID=1872578 RepID=UPI0025BA86A7|nr:hypothetical protein [Aquabacterium sp.]
MREPFYKKGLQAIQGHSQPPQALADFTDLHIQDLEGSHSPEQAGYPEDCNNP